MGYPPSENFHTWRYRNAIFGTCHDIKIDLEYENGKRLQVTTIKITESKENISMYRLDLFGSTGAGRGGGGGGGFAAAPPASR